MRPSGIRTATSTLLSVLGSGGRLAAGQDLSASQDRLGGGQPREADPPGAGEYQEHLFDCFERQRRLTDEWASSVHVIHRGFPLEGPAETVRLEGYAAPEEWAGCRWHAANFGLTLPWAVVTIELLSVESVAAFRRVR